MRNRYAAGMVSGSIAGVVMAVAMMAYMYLTGRSIWTNPNLIAAMWMGKDAAGPAFSTATLVGFLTHEITSALMGAIAIPFIIDLPKSRTIPVSIAYALASYPFVFAFVLSWANPLMVERSELIPMTLGHILFGSAMGFLYVRIITGNPTMIGR